MKVHHQNDRLPCTKAPRHNHHDGSSEQNTPFRPTEASCFWYSAALSLNSIVLRSRRGMRSSFVVVVTVAACCLLRPVTALTEDHCRFHLEPTSAVAGERDYICRNPSSSVASTVSWSCDSPYGDAYRVTVWEGSSLVESTAATATRSNSFDHPAQEDLRFVIANKNQVGIARLKCVFEVKYFVARSADGELR